MGGQRDGGTEAIGSSTHPVLAAGEEGWGLEQPLRGRAGGEGSRWAVGGSLGVVRNLGLLTVGHRKGGDIAG